MAVQPATSGPLAMAPPTVMCRSVFPLSRMPEVPLTQTGDPRASSGTVCAVPPLGRACASGRIEAVSENWYGAGALTGLLVSVTDRETVSGIPGQSPAG